MNLQVAKNFILSVMIVSSLSLKSQNIIDIHSHNVIKAQLDVLERHNALLEETFPLPAWSVEAHIRFMDEAGIKKSLLSMPAPQPYFGDSDECCKVIRRYNQETAELKEKFKDRFIFCASLPLPDVEASISEAIYALDTLKADAIKLPTNSRGQYLGDKELDELMEVLNKRSAVIIIHPHKPVPVNDSIIQITPLAMYEYPAETTRAVVNMISGNVLARYPNVKVVVPHCGSFLPLAIPRMKAIHQAMLNKGLMEDLDWEENLSKLYYDLAGMPTLEIIKMMLTITTVDHLLYGSDYPYQPSKVLQSNIVKLKDVLASDDDLNMWVDDVLYKNAQKLFYK
ncbi:MAG: amidohydrolase family protein [Bacteroidales bacterium]|nr:amidohydrolase family protein [Bacteroidales bacterium]